MAKKLVEIEWKPRQKKFVDVESGLEVRVVKVFGPREYDIQASARLPLMWQVWDRIPRLARRVGANAYRLNCVQTDEYEYSSRYTVIVELYQITKKQR